MSTPAGNEGEAAHRTNLRLALLRSLYLDRVAADLGLNRTDFDCLLVLMLDGPMTAGALSEAMGLTTGGVSGILDRLERYVYVVRETDPDDRRRSVVRVTEAGVGEADSELAPLRAEAERLAAGPVDLQAESESWAKALEAIRRGRYEVTGPFALPLDGRRGATLEITGGPATFELAAAPMDDLLRFDLPESVVRMRVRGDTVRMATRARGKGNGRIELNPDVTWTLRFHGGVNHVFGDLSGLDLAALDFYGGANEAGLKVGQPTGAVPVRVNGGSNVVRLERPAGCGASVRVQGVAVLHLDGEELGSSAHSTWQKEGSGEGGYAISVRGGANKLTLS
jgi:DNA-binding MarR family transcriptional regulator